MMWRGVPVPTFEEGSDVEAYLERLECFMTMVRTTDKKQLSVLLCGLSSVQYETLRDLVAPETPKDVTFDDLTAKLKSRYGSTRNIRMERAKFRSIGSFHVTSQPPCWWTKTQDFSFCKQTKRSQRNSKQFTPKGRKSDSRKGTQNQIEEGAADAEKETSSHSVTFLRAVSNTSGETPKCVAEVLGENIPFLIDSGAVANTVSKKIYEMIKDKVTLDKASKTLHAFGHNDPLNMKGQFHAVVKVQDNSVNALLL